METTRQKKVSRLLQKELGIILQKKGNEIGHKIITVTVVRVSPDLTIARVYLSIFPNKPDENSLETIVKMGSQIRYELGQKVKNQLRVIPELNFFIDDSLDYIENIDNLLSE